MALTGHVIIDEEEEEYFQYRLEWVGDQGIYVSVYMEEPYLAGEHAWKDLIAAIRNRTPYCLGLYNGNGVGYIGTDDKNLTIEVGPSGAGGDVTTKITLPLHDSQADLFTELISHPTCQAYWASRALRVAVPSN